MNKAQKKASMDGRLCHVKLKQMNSMEWQQRSQKTIRNCKTTTAIAAELVTKISCRVS